ncbi:MAG: Methionine--tRNA ligase [Candidatus Heimdallarchaeota archaeon LC_2]|nr:MAG: Methionine--tRNA ligase [Candidatus Heimdallarchaeota archaeon LC_2]
MSERYIITSALPYINGVKHLGNLIGSLLPADVYTRYLKLQDKDVIYICGTDDHGTPAELSAQEAGKPVEEYCEEMYEIQKQIYDDFNLNFDYFGRTSDSENHKITQEIFMGLYKNGFIDERTSTQLYSLDDSRYLPDRYVIGTCPHCKYERARGDQCENCTKLLDPIELISPKSAISGGTNIEFREVRHLYIDLPKLQPKVEEWIEKQGHWPLVALSIAKKWLKEGLKARAITRNLEWGIDVPLEGYDDVKFYVWFDAPIGYISMTKKWAKLNKKSKKFSYYWKSPKTKLIQFMAKDNVPFHSVTFPASIIGADLGYQLVHSLKGFQWLTYEGGKFSTSLNRGIFTDEALKLYPADYWRYYLLLIAPERQDTDFQWNGFQSAVNNDLNNLLGNLINRFTTFCSKHFANVIPEYKKGELEKQLIKNCSDLLTEYKTTFDQIEFQKPLKALRKFWQDCNRYFQQSEPWKSADQEIDKTATVIGTTAHALRISAILFAPFAPNSAEKIFEVLGYDKSEVHTTKWDEINDWDTLVGTQIQPLTKNLYTKISNKEIANLQKRYGSASISNKSSKKIEEKKVKQEKSNTVEYEDFAKLNLITVKVLNVKKHPKADKLLILTVDDGTRNDRIICAGIASTYDPKVLIGRQVIIVDNLKPRKLRGIMSEGMILAAEDERGISLLQPDRDIEPGVKVQ